MKHRMTRTATRICIEALKEYLPKLAPAGQEIAHELIENMTTELNHSFVNRSKQPDRAEKRYTDAPGPEQSDAEP